ncbi:MAG: glycogen synthase [Candidatus Omnitrophica bacterium]|nr:glycogen synthase [Candidatus Omnitrophota bacterium]
MTMKVLFCASEVVPFAKTGGLADVCGALPPVLAESGVEVKIVMPKYGWIDEKKFGLIRVNDEFFKAKLSKNVDVFFVENEYYYGRDGLYGNQAGDFIDNLERFKFFNLQVLKLLKVIDWPCDIIHCHDWHTALIPVYLKTTFKNDDFYKSIKTVLTIHNMAFQGVFSKNEYPKLDLPDDLLTDKGFYFYDKINFLKAGIIFSDEVTTVSPQYATDIQTDEFGCGLNNILRQYQHGVAGILNGLDYDYWSPEKDELITKKYNLDSFVEGKLENKIELQKQMNLPVNVDVPVFGFVGRISHQKGMDVLIQALKELDVDKIQVIIQGLGDERYQNELRELQKKHKEKLSTVFEFNERLAHMIYAGSDWFLMPSEFEPCGLTQMISMYYGAPPIVNRTGGLADTVESFDPLHLTGNGMVCPKNTPDVLAGMIRRAIHVFHDKKVYFKLVSNAMQTTFPWKDSAEKYKELYLCLLSE